VGKQAEEPRLGHVDSDDFELVDEEAIKNFD
jgi:hypothetical protein